MVEKWKEVYQNWKLKEEIVIKVKGSSLLCFESIDSLLNIVNFVKQ